MTATTHGGSVREKAPEATRHAKIRGNVNGLRGYDGRGGYDKFGNYANGYAYFGKHDEILGAPDSVRPDELGKHGFYVGMADARLDRLLGGTPDRNALEYAVRIYHQMGVLGTRHVKRRLDRVCATSPYSVPKLAALLKELGNVA